MIGQNGQVGWELRRTLFLLGDIVSTERSNLDLTDMDSIRRCIRETHPDLIVNAAAYTAVDQAERESDQAFRINAEAPGLMAEEAAKTGAILVHYSTDYIFDGHQDTPVREEEACAPLNVYGRSKLAGEEAILATGARHLIFRLCWVYGNRGRNFFLTMLRLAKERERLRVVQDQIGCPTWSRLIAQSTAMALQQVIVSRDSEPLLGVYHLCARGQTSWHGFAKAIVESMPPRGRKCQAVEPIATAEYPTAAMRPRYSALATEKFEATFGLRLPAWEDSLSLVMQESAAL